MSLVPGVLHTVRRGVEARPLTLCAIKGNFDFFSPGAELILASVSDRHLSYMMVLNSHLCYVAYSDKYRGLGSRQRQQSSVSSGEEFKRL